MALVTRFNLDDILGQEIVDFAVLDSNYQLLGNNSAHLQLPNVFASQQTMPSFVLTGAPAPAGRPAFVLGWTDATTPVGTFDANVLAPVGGGYWRDDGATLWSDAIGSRAVLAAQGTVYLGSAADTYVQRAAAGVTAV